MKSYEFIREHSVGQASPVGSNKKVKKITTQKRIEDLTEEQLNEVEWKKIKKIIGAGILAAGLSAASVNTANAGGIFSTTMPSARDMAGGGIADVDRTRAETELIKQRTANLKAQEAGLIADNNMRARVDAAFRKAVHDSDLFKMAECIERAAQLQIDANDPAASDTINFYKIVMNIAVQDQLAYSNPAKYDTVEWENKKQKFLNMVRQTLPRQ